MRGSSWIAQLRAFRRLPTIVRDFGQRIHSLDAAESHLLTALKETEERLTARINVLHDIEQHLMARTDGVHILLEQASNRFSLYLGDHTALASTIWDTLMFLDTRDVSFGPHLLKNRVWEPSTTRVYLDLLKPGMTVIEVGANFGYFTLLGARIVGPTGKYYAFEPNDDTCRYLRLSVAVNGLTHIATVINMAVSDQSGTVVLHKSAMYATNSNIIPTNEASRSNDDASFTDSEIAMVSLDDYFSDTVARIDFVKIDAEGSEPKIVRGMERILRANPHIRVMIEYARWWIAQSEDPLLFLRSLQDLGFRFWMIADSEGIPAHERASDFIPSSLGELIPISIDELREIPFCELLAARTLEEYDTPSLQKPRTPSSTARKGYGAQQRTGPEGSP